MAGRPGIVFFLALPKNSGSCLVETVYVSKESLLDARDTNVNRLQLFLPLYQSYCPRLLERVLFSQRSGLLDLKPTSLLSNHNCTVWPITSLYMPRGLHPFSLHSLSATTFSLEWSTLTGQQFLVEWLSLEWSPCHSFQFKCWAQIHLWIMISLHKMWAPTPSQVSVDMVLSLTAPWQCQPLQVHSYDWRISGLFPLSVFAYKTESKDCMKPLAKKKTFRGIW